VGLLSANGIAQAEVDANEIGFNQVESLLSDQSEAVVVYANNEPVQLQAQGIDVNIIYVSDFIDMVANGIITNEMTMAEDPEMVQRFVTATLRGLQDTLANPAEAYEISQKFVEGLGDERMNVLEARCLCGRLNHWAYLTGLPGKIRSASLLEMGFLDAPLADLDAAFTNQFVEE
jgi:NitT/TauT family transport system substrate-binding protein